MSCSGGKCDDGGDMESSSGIQSINDDFTPDQSIVGTDGITVETVMGTTTITGNGAPSNPLLSINSDTTQNQLIVGSNGITVSTSFGTTTINGTGLEVTMDAPQLFTSPVSVVDNFIDLVYSGQTLQLSNSQNSSYLDTRTNTSTGSSSNSGYQAINNSGTTFTFDMSGSNNSNAGEITTSSGAIGINVSAQGSGKAIKLFTNSIERGQFDDTGLNNTLIGQTTPELATITTLTLVNPLTIGNGGTSAGSKQAAFDNLSPSSTKGQIIVYNGTHNVSLPVGSDGQVLASASAAADGVEWTSITNTLQFTLAFSVFGIFATSGSPALPFWESLNVDSYGGFTEDQYYTLPYTGYYYVTGQVAFSSPSSNTGTATLNIEHNGTIYTSTVVEVIANTDIYTMQVSAIVSASSGDTISLTISTTVSGGISYETSDSNSFFNIESCGSGSSLSTVAFQAQTNSTTSTTAGVNIMPTWNNVIIDTASGFSSNTYTTTIPGLWFISSSSAVTLSSTDTMAEEFYIKGSLYNPGKGFNTGVSGQTINARSGTLLFLYANQTIQQAVKTLNTQVMAGTEINTSFSIFNIGQSLQYAGFQVSSSDTTTLTANTPYTVTWGPDAGYDNLLGWNGSTTYVVQSTGFYAINCILTIANYTSTFTGILSVNLNSSFGSLLPYSTQTFTINSSSADNTISLYVILELSVSTQVTIFVKANEPVTLIGSGKNDFSIHSVGQLLGGSFIGVSSVGLSVTAGGDPATVLSVVPSSTPVTGTGTLEINYSGNALPTANGGTDQTSSGSDGNILQSNGTNWQSVSLPDAGIPTLSGTNTFTGTNNFDSNVTINDSVFQITNSTDNVVFNYSPSGSGIISFNNGVQVNIGSTSSFNSYNTINYYGSSTTVINDVSGNSTTVIKNDNTTSPTFEIVNSAGTPQLTSTPTSLTVPSGATIGDGSGGYLLGSSGLEYNGSVAVPTVFAGTNTPNLISVTFTNTSWPYYTFSIPAGPPVYVTPYGYYTIYGNICNYNGVFTLVSSTGPSGINTTVLKNIFIGLPISRSNFTQPYQAVGTWNINSFGTPGYAFSPNGAEPTTIIGFYGGSILADVGTPYLNLQSNIFVGYPAYTYAYSATLYTGPYSYYALNINFSCTFSLT